MEGAGMVAPVFHVPCKHLLARGVNLLGSLLELENDSGPAVLFFFGERSVCGFRVGEMVAAWVWCWVSSFVSPANLHARTFLLLSHSP